MAAHFDGVEYRVHSLQEWKQSTLVIGIVLFLSVVLVALSVDGEPLHRYWDGFGRTVTVVAMLTLCAFCFSAGITVVLWRDLKNLKRRHTLK